MVEELGRMEKVNPGLAWRNEARDFTPWLQKPRRSGGDPRYRRRTRSCGTSVGGFSLDRKAAPTHTPAHHPREEALAGARGGRNRGGETDQPAKMPEPFSVRRRRGSDAATNLRARRWVKDSPYGTDRTDGTHIVRSSDMGNHCGSSPQGLSHRSRCPTALRESGPWQLHSH